MKKTTRRRKIEIEIDKITNQTRKKEKEVQFGQESKQSAKTEQRRMRVRCPVWRYGIMLLSTTMNTCVHICAISESSSASVMYFCGHILWSLSLYECRIVTCTMPTSRNNGSIYTHRRENIVFPPAASATTTAAVRTDDGYHLPIIMLRG